ncbi:MAG TPA: hypothetical protein VG125_23005 [Pirellulales bacterium]|jgi:hypothetical protein|nr:hypothetical protein [Pirellulales bacterium]
MWRAFFLALGIYCCVLGAECLLIEKATLTSRSDRQGALGLGIGAPKREVIPSDWAPWSLLSAGAVTILYSFTLPQRLQKT